MSPFCTPTPDLHIVLADVFSLLRKVSQYSFESHSKSYAIKVLDLKSGSSTVLYENPAYTEPTWVSDTEFVVVDNRDGKSTALLAGDVTSPGSE